MEKMEKAKDEKIVIIGFGWVGQANALALVQMGYEVCCYDVLPPKYHYEGGDYKHLYEKVTVLTTPLEMDGAHTAYLVCVGDRVDDEGDRKSVV